MINSYPLDQCALYRIGSKKRLARTLCVSRAVLKQQEENPTFGTVINNGKTFYPPVGALRKIHDRLLKLLKRVTSREYHMSDKKGCSNVMNAGRHALKSYVVKTDVKNYYPSVTQDAVVKFFQVKLQTSKPVANALGKLLCKDGFLVKGSPVSGFIAFWSNVDMFDKISWIVGGCDATLTVYVDDLTVSMRHYDPNLLKRIDGVIKQYGYIPHKQKTYSSADEKIITGVVLSSNGYRARKKTMKKRCKGQPKNVQRGASQYVAYVDGLNLQ